MESHDLPKLTPEEEKKNLQIKELLEDAKNAEIGRKEAVQKCICGFMPIHGFCLATPETAVDETILSNCPIHGWEDEENAYYDFDEDEWDSIINSPIHGMADQSK